MPTDVQRYCIDCLYPLHSLREHRCPECGAAFDPDDEGSYLRSPRRPSKIAMPTWLSIAWLIVLIAFVGNQVNLGGLQFVILLPLVVGIGIGLSLAAMRQKGAINRVCGALCMIPHILLALLHVGWSITALVGP